MLLTLSQAINLPPFQSKPQDSIFSFNPSSSPTSLLLQPKSTLFPPSFNPFGHHHPGGGGRGSSTHNKHTSSSSRKFRTCASFLVQASLVESPILWAVRVCVFYALLKSGVAGSKSNPLVAGLEGDDEVGETGDLGFSKWVDAVRGKPEKGAAEERTLVTKWHPTTKGTLKRNYKVPSKSEGQRLLRAVASLLSEDDHFLDAATHKGCQIRRQNAHGESVCCNNVRALFDELPTPHLIVEITPFPAGPLTENDYLKAEKLERVLRSSPSV